MPFSQSVNLDKYFWRIVSEDENTLSFLFLHLHDTVPGPHKPINLYHSLYNEKAKTSYNVPYLLIEIFMKNKSKLPLVFQPFSRVSKQVPWAAYFTTRDAWDQAMKSKSQGQNFPKKERKRVIT